MMKQKNRYPEKQTLNLAMREQSMGGAARLIPLFLVLFVLLAAFAKFAVVDRLLAVSLAERECADLAGQLAALNVSADEQQDLITEYARYSSNWMNEQERACVDQSVVFRLLEQHVLPSAMLRDLSFSQNVLMLNLTNLSLRDASDIVSRLHDQPEVVDVTVSTAGAGTSALDQTKKGSVSMSITLANGTPMPEEGGEDE